tara:strand:+ start:54 stop:1025 length:972 start_codon:yes stop_codon:yes gene_type:complete
VSKKEFGGYLPLEISEYRKEYYYTNKNFKVLSLNSARAGFYFAAKNSNIKRIFLPILTCPQTEGPFKKLGLEVLHYKLDQNLLPKNLETDSNDCLLWTNYYGNASEKDKLAMLEKFPNLIIDNCHAFFSKPLKNAFNCYSTRKFFGVSDGGYLIKEDLNLNQEINEDISYKNITHLIQQIETGINSGYKKNLINEDRLNNKYLRMSRFTKKVLKSINYEKVMKIRKENLLSIHSQLDSINEFEVNLNSETHIYYPFLRKDKDLRYRLIEKKLYNPNLWGHVINSTNELDIENYLSKFMILLPIDQRYTKDDMDEICKIVKSSL